MCGNRVLLVGAISSSKGLGHHPRYPTWDFILDRAFLVGAVIEVIAQMTVTHAR